MTPLWIDFVNSDWHDPLGQAPPQDRLESRTWLRAFLESNALEAVDPSDPRTVSALKALRADIQHCVGRLVDGGALSADDIRPINNHLRAHHLVAQLERRDDAFHLRLDPAARGVDAVVHAIVRSFAEFLCDEDRTRLKRCENPDCRWLFYDTTRSRTRCWCDDSCGNLMKVRRFRERHKGGRGR